ncbi:MAG: DUF4965 domain-containing protein [Lentisphaeria bacterium]|nr:DUF4965 domain-containing protein [Lentisphaeria bacterium]
MNKYRMPAYPLIVHDPFFSVWSSYDNPADGFTRHWSGHLMNICCLASVDGECFHLIGPSWDMKKAPVEPVWEVTATRTTLKWQLEKVCVSVNFLTPALLDKLDVLSRPASYISYCIENTDGKKHTVRIMFYFDASLTAVPQTEVLFGRMEHPAGQIAYVGAKDQRPLYRSGDSVPNEWGYFYVALPHTEKFLMKYCDGIQVRRDFCDGSFNGYDYFSLTNNANPRGIAVCSQSHTFADGRREGWFVVAHDDIVSIEFLRQPLYGYWRKYFCDMGELLNAVIGEYPLLKEECARFDREFAAETAAVGGERYTFLCNAAYRQAIGGHKLTADAAGRPLFFSKENHSNGCIATVDVTYPSVPLFFRFAPELVEGMLRPVMEYASTNRWKFDFAPHDLGTYPLANGQVYGGGEVGEENQMPVEECGNILILCTALLHYRPETTLVAEYLPLLKKWAEYLLQKGYDPENQLCTDDFAGHLAHNTNLSLKAIVALAGYARIAEKYGNSGDAAAFLDIAKRFAVQWLKEADDGDHYRLAFDQPGTWSLKYNLLWDQLLDLKLFPRSVIDREIAFYRKKQNKYGVPLDNRKEYTKSDWLLWIAALTENREDFDMLTEPVCRWLNETPSRKPLGDWYETGEDGIAQGFTGRSVVGGFFAPLLMRRRDFDVNTPLKI